MSRRLRELMVGAALALGLAACGDADVAEAPDGQAASPTPSTLGQVAESEAQARAEEARAAARPRPMLRRTVGEGELTPEILNTTALSGTPLRNARISPDGSRVTFLKGSEADANQLDLYSFDVETGEESLLVSSLDLLGAPEELSEEEKNRRERAREYGRGIISYSWVDADTLLFPLGGDVYLYDLTTGEPQQVTATDGYESDIKLSADKRYVAYVRDDEIYATEIATGLERQITRGASETVRNGVASFVVQEELGRSTGYWISPDETRVAYTQIDESPIAIEVRADMGPEGLRTLEQRYPFAGTPNAKVRLGVTRLDGSRRTVWADIPGWDAEDDIYLTRVAWSPDGDTVYAGILSRDHTTHTVYAVEAATGAASVVYEETSPTWLNIRGDIAPTEAGLRMVSERDGIRRLYALSEGSVEALTPEGLLVNNVRCVAEDGTVFVEGWRDDPLQRHVWRVVETAAATEAETEAETESETLGGGDGATTLEATKISSGEGQWSASFAEDCSRWIGRFSSETQPPQSAVYTADGERLFWLNENKVEGSHPFAPYAEKAVSPERGTITAADGSELHYVLYKPRDLRAGERRPSITIVYGGPGVQRVSKRWRGQSLPQMLAAHGFVVFQLDGRGSSNRGKAFEDPLHRNMAGIEVEDQVAGARWLKRQDFIDPDAMGVYGWSYGGYMVLHMLGQTDEYAAGVSGAPVTDWRLYDTAYTERYLGDPNPGTPNHTEGAYERGNVMTHIEGLDEPVLVIHGMADDNVQFRHSVLLADAMIKAGKTNMTLMPYPGEKHGFRDEKARIHKDRMVLEFFLDELGGSEG